MPKTDKKTKEAQLQQVWRMLLESKTHEEIAKELGVATKTIQRISQELDKRYGEAQRQKTNDTIYLECTLFKNRMLTLYKSLEKIVTGYGPHTGTERARCAEVAANIAIDILKMESESVKSSIIAEKQNKNIGSSSNNTPSTTTTTTAAVRGKAISDHTKGIRLLQNNIQQQSSTGAGGGSTEQSTTAENNMVPRELDDPEETC
ncbi:MAG: hypothetical protein ACM3VV_04265 [Deltaproteobacteria bacterium]